MNQLSCIFMRGGTSKGPFLDLRELPTDPDARNNVLLKIMGSPDAKQINGIGGATFVTSKVVMVQPSKREGIDVDYLFAQVFIDQNIVDTKPTCGNMMSGVAPYAIEKGWVKPISPTTTVTVYNINTNSTAEMQVHTDNEQVKYEGDFEIDGVPGTGSPILMRLRDIEGGATGSLFPTGNIIDTIQGKEVTMFDAGNLMIHLRASDFGLKGDESALDLMSTPDLLQQLESIRCEIADKAGMGDVSDSVLPKIGLLAPPQSNGQVKSWYFTPKTLHPTHAVSGAVCVMAASKCQGTVANSVATQTNKQTGEFILEHQSGVLPVELDTEGAGLNFTINSAGTYRTARMLMSGVAYY